MSSGVCPLCKGDARLEPPGHSGAWDIECARCGRFMMAAPLLSLLRAGLSAEEDKRLLPYLPAYTRQETEKGGRVLVTRNWQELTRPHVNTPVSEKAVKLLKLVAARSAHPGAPVEVNAGLDYPLVDGGSAGAFNFLVDYLLGSGSLRHEGGQRYSLTAFGWESLGRLLVDDPTSPE